MALMAVGSLLVSVLVSVLGLDAALAILGASTGIGLLLGAARFRHVGGDLPPPPEHIVARVLADPVFAHLRGPAVARLADRIEIVTAQPWRRRDHRGRERRPLLPGRRRPVGRHDRWRGRGRTRRGWLVRRDRTAPRRAPDGDGHVRHRGRVVRDLTRRLPDGGDRSPASLATATQIADDLAPR